MNDRTRTNPLLSDDDLDAALATLDPAPAPDPHATGTPGARRLLADVLADRGLPDDDAAGAATGHARHTGWSRRRRFVTLAGAAAALAVGVVVAPGLLGSGDAMASWTAIPAAASSEDRAEAAEQCFGLLDVGPGTDPDLHSRDELDALDVVLAERRGEFTLVLLGDGEIVADCLILDPQGPLSMFGIGSGGAGSGGYRPVPILPAPDGVSEAQMTAMSSEGTFHTDRTAVLLTGLAGEDVTGMTVHLLGGPQVEATVTDGYFAAWVPVDATAGELDEVWSQPLTATLTLADGSQVVDQIRPA